MIWVLQQPTAVVGSLIVVSTVALAVLGLAAFRRSVSLKRLQRAKSVTTATFTLVGVLYSLVAAFALNSVWASYRSAEAAVENEASAIRDMLYESEALPPATGALLQKELLDYVNNVIGDEFDRIRNGVSIERGSVLHLRLRRTLYSSEPTTRSQIGAYEEAVRTLEDLSSSRSARIASGASALTVDLWVLLVGGAVICVVFTYMLVTEDFVIHAVVVGLSAALMAFVLYLILTLDRPFVGSLSVSTTPYQNVIDSWTRTSATPR